MTDKIIKTDICIIGAGSGGLSVAAGAAQLGLDVVLIEKGEMGGDCLNTGCVPSKALLAAAKSAQTFRQAGKFGIKPQEPDIDFAAIKDHVKEVIAKIEPHDSQERFEKLGVTVIRETASFISSQNVRAGDTVITAKNFVIATGSQAFLPPIKGLNPQKALTNENIFECREKPDHLIIIGGGPIGVEMAQAHKRLGCDVTILDRGPILPKDDPELTAIIRTSLENENVQINEHITIDHIAHDNGVSVTFEKEGQKETIKGSHILIAAGRKPNTEALTLENAGVLYDKTGIKTNKRLQTSARHIYATGDVTGGPQFTHIAGYQAGIVIRNLLFKIPAKVGYSALPWVTYTEPELAQTGMTEAMAREEHGDKIKVTTWSFDENDRATAEKRNEGMIKVITTKNGRILGASIAGPHAGEMIGLWSLALSRKMKIGAIAGMIAPYPTFGEISKRAAGAYYTPSLFSDKTKKIVKLLQKLPW